MPTTFHLRVWTRFLAPPDQVWLLKTDPAALAAEFRPFLSLRVGDPRPLADALDRGEPATVDARLCPRGLPFGVRWPIHLRGGTRPTVYTDASENRIYSRFEHEHRFEPTSDGCRYLDAVTFVPALPASKLVAILTRRFFVHRHTVAARRLPSDPQATGVSVLRVLVEAEWVS